MLSYILQLGEIVTPLIIYMGPSMIGMTRDEWEEECAEWQAKIDALTADREMLNAEILRLDSQLQSGAEKLADMRQRGGELYATQQGRIVELEARLSRIAELLSAHRPDELDLAECRKLARV